MSRRLIILLALACGIAVANLYYNQSMLTLFMQTFHCSQPEASLIACVTQISYAVGLFLFVPLGDKLKRYRLILGLTVANMLGLILAALSANYTTLLLANILIGMTSVSAQIILPAVSLLATPESRGKIVGAVMCGLFAGIVLARTLSGFVGEYAGWRTMYILSAILDVVLILIIYGCLPRTQTITQLSWPALIKSMGQILIQEPLLRSACLSGFLMFAAFSALWGSLTWLLNQSPYYYGSDIAGLFGLAGIVGIVFSSSIGALSDKYGGNLIVTLGAILTVLAFVILSQNFSHLLPLIIGILLLDLGSRAGLVGNQIRIYAFPPEVRSRVNTLFMSCYFLGGALGTRLGSLACTWQGWQGVAFVGTTAAFFGIVLSASEFKSKRLLYTTKKSIHSE